MSNLAADLAAELKAGRVYQQLYQSIDDAGVRRALEFLEEREATHGRLFGEAQERVKDEAWLKRWAIPGCHPACPRSAKRIAC